MHLSRTWAAMVMILSSASLLGFLSLPVLSAEVWPVLSSLSPLYGPPGSVVTVTGNDLGNDKGQVEFWPITNGNLISAGANIMQWSNNKIIIDVPKNLPIGNYSISVVTSDGKGAYANTGWGELSFQVIDSQGPPNVSQMSLITKSTTNQELSIVGSGFGEIEHTITLTSGREQVDLTPTKWTDTLIIGNIPSGIIPGKYSVTINIPGMATPAGTVDLMDVDDTSNSEQYLDITMGSRHVTLFGKSETFPVASLIYEGWPYIPLRLVAAALKMHLSWDNKSKEVTIYRGSNTHVDWGTIAMRIIPDTVFDMIDGHSSVFTGPPLYLVAPGYTMVPLSFVSDELEASTIWDAATNRLLIVP